MWSISVKAYFVVEGEATELFVYPEWIKNLKPELTIFSDYDDFVSAESGIYFVSGYGYPNIFNEIANAVKNINKINDVDCFCVILDADEDEAEIREKAVKEVVLNEKMVSHTNLEVVVQNRCFETFLLGNQKCFSRQTTNAELIKLIQYYDVLNNDPELMGNYSQDFTHSQFHFKYAVTMLREKRVRYTKSSCGAVAEGSFYEALVQRIKSTTHLDSFRRINDILNKL